MSLNTWINKTKTFTGSYFPIKIPLPARIGGVTVYGAIGYPLRRPVFHLAEATNIEGYATFIRKITCEIRVSDPVGPRNTKPWIIYDGHTAHKNKEILKLMRKSVYPKQ